MRRNSLICITLALVIVPSVALADSISPASYTTSIGVGESVTITKTITVDSASTANLDVYFVFDATGSMADLLEAARGAAVTLVPQLAALYPNLWVGVGYYQDFPQAPYGDSGNTPFAQTLDLGGTIGAATHLDSAIAALGALPGATGGNDGPESSFYALNQVATGASWRADAGHVIVWFGDFVSHDGDIEPAYPDRTGLADVIGSLTAGNIIVEAISLGTGVGLDGSWDLSAAAGGVGPPFVNVSGQATAIANATGGDVTTFTGAINVDTVKSAIVAAVNSGFFDYTQVGLATAFADAGLGVSWVALDADGGTTWDGDFDRSISRSFTFEVTYEGNSVGVYTFSIDGLIDGGPIVSERDVIYVGRDVPDVPEPSTIALMGFGLLGLGFAARRKLRK